MERRDGRTRQLAGLAVLLAAAVGVACYAFGRRKAELNVPLLDGSTVTVVPGVHLLGGIGPSAAYAVETADGLIQIDTGLDEDAQRLKAELAAQGLDWKKTRAVFLTHVHGDHSGGAQHLRTETGARIHAGQADAPMLVAGGPRDAFFSTFKMPNQSLHPTTVDVALRGQEIMTFGDVRLQVLATPGHTAGSTCYLVERDGLRLLFSGDVIVRMGETPLGTYSTYLAPRFGGNAQAYLESLQKLRTLPVPDLILPGHPNASVGPQSPQLDQEQWETMLDEGIRDMEVLTARYAAGGARFLDGVPKRLLPDLYYFGDFHGAAVYGLFSSSQFFLFNAPGGPDGSGLREFLKQQLETLGLKPTEPTAVLLTDCGKMETAGLPQLVVTGPVNVIAAPSAVDTVKKLCPPGTTVTTIDQMPDKNQLSLTAVPLHGRGVAPIAYQIRWAGNTVLISGQTPIVIDAQSRAALQAELTQSESGATDYINSLRKLAQIQPDLWLPFLPVDAQNATMTEATWKTMLDKNFRAASEIGQQGR